MYDLLQLDFGRGDGKGGGEEEEIGEEKERGKREGFVKHVKGAGARYKVSKDWFLWE